MVFFFQIFSIKYSWNLLGSKYDFTIVTFNSWTDTHQFSAPQNSHWYLILLFGKWWVLKQNGLRFLVQNRTLLSASFVFSRKSNVVCWQDIIIPRQRNTGGSNIFNKYQHCLYKHFDSLGYIFNLPTKKTMWLNSCFNKLSFYAQLLY